jgi:hypothetical protein
MSLVDILQMPLVDALQIPSGDGLYISQYPCYVYCTYVYTTEAKEMGHQILKEGKGIGFIRRLGVANRQH